MKKIILCSVLSLFSILLIEGQSNQQKSRVNFYDIQKAFYQQWEGKEPKPGQGYKQFKRWEAFMEPRLSSENGEFINASQIMWEEMNAYRKDYNRDGKIKPGCSTAEWTELGPRKVQQSDKPINEHGRISFIRFNGEKDIYVGSSSGGIWKSENSGNGWKPLSDYNLNLNDLCAMGVSDLLFTKDNSGNDIMLLATGDPIIQWDGGFNSNPYSLGLLRRGVDDDDWVPVNINDFPGNGYYTDIAIRKLIAHKSGLYFTSTKGLYRSSDGGLSWNKIANTSGENLYDILILPDYESTNPDDFNNDLIYISTNTGKVLQKTIQNLSDDMNWTIVLNSFGARVAMAASSKITGENGGKDYFKLYAVVAEPYPIAPSYKPSKLVGVFSTDTKTNEFTKVFSQYNLLGRYTKLYEQDDQNTGQGWYDLAIVVDPLNPETVYLGGINLYKSINGGQKWIEIAGGSGEEPINYIHYNEAVLFDESNLKTKTFTLNMEDAMFKRPKKMNNEGICEKEDGMYYYETHLFETTVAEGNTMEFSIFPLSEDPLTKGYMYIYEEDDNIEEDCPIQPTGITNSGTFRFKGLEACKTYKMLITSEDPQKEGKVKIELYSPNDFEILKPNSGYCLERSKQDIHYDVHVLKFGPDNKTLYVGTDGGISKTSNGGSSFEVLSDGLGITQYYAFGNKDDLIVAGSQDNGVNKTNTTSNTTNNIWKHIQLGDGGECEMTNDAETGKTILYFGDYHGKVYRADDVDNIVDNTSFTSIICTPKNFSGEGFNVTNESPSFITRALQLDLTNNNRIYVGHENIWYHNNKGIPDATANKGWKKISIPGISQAIYTMKIDQTGQKCFVTKGANLHYSNNFSNTNPTFTSTIPGENSTWISDIEIDENNGDRIWLSYSGYDANNKIRYSSDGGKIWTNTMQSSDLPNLPVNTLVYDENKDILFIGTDVGIYAGNTTNLAQGTGKWVRVSPINGDKRFPNVIVSELEIINGGVNGDILRAATHGRGIWETNIEDVICCIRTDTPGYIEFTDEAYCNIQNSYGKVNETLSMIITLTDPGPKDYTLNITEYPSMEGTAFGFVFEDLKWTTTGIKTIELILGEGEECIFTWEIEIFDDPLCDDEAYVIKNEPVCPAEDFSAEIVFPDHKSDCFTYRLYECPGTTPIQTGTGETEENSILLDNLSAGQYRFSYNDEYYNCEDEIYFSLNQIAPFNLNIEYTSMPTTGSDIYIEGACNITATLTYDFGLNNEPDNPYTISWYSSNTNTESNTINGSSGTQNVDFHDINYKSFSIPDDLCFDHYIIIKDANGCVWTYTQSSSIQASSSDCEPGTQEDNNNGDNLASKTQTDNETYLYLLPTPFKKTLNLNFNVSGQTEKSHIKIVLYDLSGKIQETLYDNSIMNNKEQNISINMKNRPAGMYLFVLETETGERIIKKGIKF